MRRVVITGMGLATPVGVGLNNAWKNLLASKSGLISTSELENPEVYKEFPAKVVGKLPSGSISEGKWDPMDHFEKHEIRKLSPFCQYALAASHEALTDAKWFPTKEKDLEGTGVVIGSGIGSIDDMYSNTIGFHERGFRKTQPLFVPRLLVNMATGNVSIKYGFKGPNHAVSTACAAGVHSIGDAARFIKDSYCDVAVAGASEAPIHPITVAGFARAKALVSGWEDNPQGASRPFDRDRNGFVLSEGSGILVLEELQHALARGVHIYGEVTGYGVTGDGSHITSPLPDGGGGRRAMEFALKQAGVKPGEIDYVNAHATSTALGDRAENFALKTIFEKENPHLAVSSCKGSMGHLLGAAGAVETIFAVLAMRDGILPPTMNCPHPGEHPGDNKEEFIFNYVNNGPQRKEIKHLLSNSFGFGGVNASLCLSKYE